MKRALSLLLILLLLCNISMAEEGRIKGMNDPEMPAYLQASIYDSLVDSLDSNDYFVENISAVYISDEYLEELAFNSQSNIYFGYNLEVLEQQFEGDRYIFTLGENNETSVQKWETYKDPVGTMIKNVAIGTGVILICVTISAVTLPTAPVISMIFAFAAKTQLKQFRRFAGGVITGTISEYAKTGDLKQSLIKASAEKSEDLKWGAIGGGITRKAVSLLGSPLTGLSTAEAATVQKESKYPLGVIKEFSSIDEYNIYKQTGLYTENVGDTTVLARTIDWNQKDGNGKTNYERITAGDNPIDPIGEEYELHYVGQKNNPVIAVLTHAESNGEGNFQQVHEGLRYNENDDELNNSNARAQFWKDFSTLADQI